MLGRLFQKVVHHLFSVIPGFSQTLHVLCFMNTKFTKKNESAIKDVNYQKKIILELDSQMGKSTLFLKTLAIMKETRIPGELSSCCN